MVLHSYIFCLTAVSLWLFYCIQTPSISFKMPSYPTVHTPEELQLIRYGRLRFAYGIGALAQNTILARLDPLLRPRCAKNIYEHFLSAGTLLGKDDAQIEQNLWRALALLHNEKHNLPPTSRLSPNDMLAIGQWLENHCFDNSHLGFVISVWRRLWTQQSDEYKRGKLTVAITGGPVGSPTS